MIHIGTSGYHFLDWVGTLYPPELAKEQWLAYYAQRFNTVEINSTYYGLPKIETVARWTSETPAGFRFIVKLHKDSTHGRITDGAEIGELLRVLEPMRQESKLFGLLAQFPASFRANDAAKGYIKKIRQEIGEIPFFVEFRHRSWDHDSSVTFCREEKIGWVAVDLPPIRSLMQARPAVTAAAGYVRFHGRNVKTWYTPEAGDRYDWDYPDSELKEWVPRLKAMTGLAEDTYLFFNNCHAGQAIKSAALMREILRNEQLEVSR